MNMSKPCVSNDVLIDQTKSNDIGNLDYNAFASRGMGLGCDDEDEDGAASAQEQAIETSTTPTAEVETTATEATEDMTTFAAEVETTGESTKAEPSSIDKPTAEVEASEETEDATTLAAEIETITIDEPTTFLSCGSANADDLEEKAGIERVDLEYDYELLMRTDVNLTSSVIDFELGLLQSVANEFDLTTCESVRRSLRRLGTASVVGVSSDPDDVKDIHTECGPNLDSIEALECNPINGKMTAWVSETDKRRLSEDDLYSAIERYSKTYATDGGVIAVSYIGTRPDIVEEPIVNAPLISQAIQGDGTRVDLAASSPNSMSPGTIAGVTVASIVALLVILALVVKKRRDRKNAREREMSSADNALVMIDEDEEE